jgi:hypothetical protein
LPHFWLPDGRSLYDVLGPEFTLIRCDPAVDAAPLLAEAAARRVPVDLLDIPFDSTPEAYRHALILSRPDGHICWRGDAVPGDAGAIIDTIAGRHSPTTAAGCVLK